MQAVFSIVTVCFNAGPLLELTMQSVRQQRYPHIEYIVIDGGSAAPTLDLIRANAGHIDQWISEPDKGIYDAMNKGLRMATGDFVWFLNAGDTIYSPDTCAALAGLIQADTDILYGETMLVNEARQEQGIRSERTVHQLPEQLQVSSMRWGMVVCHQSILVRRQIAPTFIQDNLSADIDWVIRSLKAARGKVVNARRILCNYLEGGISKQKHRRSLRDRYDILEAHFGFLPNLWHHGQILLRALRRKFTHRSTY